MVSFNSFLKYKTPMDNKQQLEKEIAQLRELQSDRNRWFSKEEFERLTFLTSEISKNMGNPSVPTPEAADKIPSAKSMLDEFCKQKGYIYLANQTELSYTECVILMESYALLREQRAVEVGRKKWEQFIVNRIDLIPDDDDLPLSQRGSLDAYINCLNYLKSLNNGK